MTARLDCEAEQGQQERMDDSPPPQNKKEEPTKEKVKSNESSSPEKTVSSKEPAKAVGPLPFSDDADRDNKKEVVKVTAPTPELQSESTVRAVASSGLDDSEEKMEETEDILVALADTEVNTPSPPESQSDYPITSESDNGQETEEMTETDSSHHDQEDKKQDVAAVGAVTIASSIAQDVNGTSSHRDETRKEGASKSKEIIPTTPETQGKFPADKETADSSFTIDKKDKTGEKKVDAAPPPLIIQEEHDGIPSHDEKREAEAVTEKSKESISSTATPEPVSLQEEQSTAGAHSGSEQGPGVKMEKVPAQPDIKDIEVVIPDDVIFPSSDPRPEKPGRITNRLKYVRYNILDQFSRINQSAPFRQPVNPKLLQIPFYYVYIKRPMDFSMIRERIRKKYYYDAQECLDDIRLVFSNAIFYNSKNSFVGKCAVKLGEILEEKLKLMPEGEEIEISELCKRPSTGSLEFVKPNEDSAKHDLRERKSKRAFVDDHDDEVTSTDADSSKTKSNESRREPAIKKRKLDFVSPAVVAQSAKLIGGVHKKGKGSQTPKENKAVASSSKVLSRSTLDDYTPVRVSKSVNPHGSRKRDKRMDQKRLEYLKNIIQSLPEPLFLPFINQLNNCLVGYSSQRLYSMDTIDKLIKLDSHVLQWRIYDKAMEVFEQARQEEKARNETSKTQQVETKDEKSTGDLKLSNDVEEVQDAPKEGKGPVKDIKNEAKAKEEEKEEVFNEDDLDVY